MPLRNDELNPNSDGLLATTLRWWNAEVLADLLGKVVVDFGVPWNRRCPT
jgi:hypothetical protein